MTSWSNRVDLARAGWKTECRVTETGISKRETHRAVGVWARTWFWHGRVAEVSLHAHGIVPIGRDHVSDEIERLTGVVHEACIRAWTDFPDTIPVKTLRQAPRRVHIWRLVTGFRRRRPDAPPAARLDRCLRGRPLDRVAMRRQGCGLISH